MGGESIKYIYSMRDTNDKSVSFYQKKIIEIAQGGESIRTKVGAL